MRAGVVTGFRRWIRSHDDGQETTGDLDKGRFSGVVGFKACLARVQNRMRDV